MYVHSSIGELRKNCNKISLKCAVHAQEATAEKPIIAKIYIFIVKDICEWLRQIVRLQHVHSAQNSIIIIILK